MKKVTIFILFITSYYAYSQNQVNYPEEGFFFRIGANFVDSSGNEEPFSVVNNFNQTANKLPLKIGIEYRWSNLFGAEADFSINKWGAGKGVIDDDLLTEDENYFAADVKLNVYVDEVLGVLEKLEWLQLYVSSGLGYFKVNEGGLSANFGFGTNMWLSEKLALNLDATAKWAFDSTPVIYDSNHFQYFAGLVFKVGKTKKRGTGVGADDNTNGGLPGGDNEYSNQVAEGESIKTLKEDLDGLKVRLKERENEVENLRIVVANLEKQNEEKLEVDIDEEDINFIIKLARKIKFDHKEEYFTPDSEPILTRILVRMLRLPDTKFIIIGHTDSTGSFEFNDKLSIARARSVMNYLIEGGVDQNNLTAQGKGELSPISSNQSSLGRQKNRRVEIILGKEED